ncbi:MAG: glycerol-3-phosphate 1-O-acyltransferase PlsY [Gemmatimonadetes bacterium]|nr:glycerol-3-phosphate 1-O-acyltransferase PlsY [Gemmatimonadota bacterium]
MTYALLAVSYLLGATPTSYWVGRVFHGIDLRKEGSGNLGATNTYRVMGLKWAVPVAAVDISKGFVPVWLFSDLAGVGFDWSLAFGGASIVGHVFSFWVGFKGGKGVAATSGVFLALAPSAALGSFLVWCLLTFPSGYVALGSIGAAASLPVFVALLPHEGGRGFVWFTIALSLFVIWAHRSNIRRLIDGTENRFGARSPQGSPPDVPIEGGEV